MNKIFNGKRGGKYYIKNHRKIYIKNMKGGNIQTFNQVTKSNKVQTLVSPRVIRQLELKETQISLCNKIIQLNKFPFKLTIIIGEDEYKQFNLIISNNEYEVLNIDFIRKCYTLYPDQNFGDSIILKMCQLLGKENYKKKLSNSQSLLRNVSIEINTDNGSSSSPHGSSSPHPVNSQPHNVVKLSKEEKTKSIKVNNNKYIPPSILSGMSNINNITQFGFPMLEVSEGANLKNVFIRKYNSTNTHPIYLYNFLVNLFSSGKYPLDNININFGIKPISVKYVLSSTQNTNGLIILFKSNTEFIIIDPNTNEYIYKGGNLNEYIKILKIFGIRNFSSIRNNTSNMLNTSDTLLRTTESTNKGEFLDKLYECVGNYLHNENLHFFKNINKELLEKLSQAMTTSKVLYGFVQERSKFLEKLLNKTKIYDDYDLELSKNYVLVCTNKKNGKVFFIKLIEKVCIIYDTNNNFQKSLKDIESVLKEFEFIILSSIVSPEKLLTYYNNQQRKLLEQKINMNSLIGNLKKELEQSVQSHNYTKAGLLQKNIQEKKSEIEMINTQLQYTKNQLRNLITKTNTTLSTPSTSSMVPLPSSSTAPPPLQNYSPPPLRHYSPPKPLSNVGLKNSLMLIPGNNAIYTKFGKNLYQHIESQYGDTIDRLRIDSSEFLSFLKGVYNVNSYKKTVGNHMPRHPLWVKNDRTYRYQILKVYLESKADSISHLILLGHSEGGAFLLLLLQDRDFCYTFRNKLSVILVSPAFTTQLAIRKGDTTAEINSKIVLQNVEGYGINFSIINTGEKFNNNRIDNRTPYETFIKKINPNDLLTLRGSNHSINGDVHIKQVQNFVDRKISETATGSPSVATQSQPRQAQRQAQPSKPGTSKKKKSNAQIGVLITSVKNNTVLGKIVEDLDDKWRIDISPYYVNKNKENISWKIHTVHKIRTPDELKKYALSHVSLTRTQLNTVTKNKKSYSNVYDELMKLFH